MQMHDADYYRKLGFKCGLEIHQRLSTKEKLFCSCSTSSANDRTTSKVMRKQRAVAGELGAVDRSTSFESSRGRSFIYNTFQRSSCLVDIDEEPPHDVNPSAVESAIRLALAFNAKLPDEIQPMRKEVVDGSDPSAFQRSMQVAYDGTVEANGKRHRISSIFLEEESSGIESNTSDTVTYNIDRIGIPLIEIDTDPTIQTPSEAREIALKIGLIIRLTGKRIGDSVESQVQRGIGTIRQDVNVSIEGGTRVEIKGLQEIDTVDVIIDNEVERQVKLLQIKKSLLAKKAKVHAAKDLTKILSGTEAKILKDAVSSNGSIVGARLEGFGGILGTEINPQRRLGSEISDYAKMAGVKGLIHSDESLEKYGITKHETEKIEKELGMKKGDAFILIAAAKGLSESAMNFALKRAEMAMAEVPPETRAVADSKAGTTRFMRPLPGGSRMYPETDAQPIAVTEKRIDSVAKSTVGMEERISRINEEISNKQLADQLIHSTKLPLYEYITSQIKGINPIVASTLLEKMKELERSGVNTDLESEVMLEIFRRYANDEITKAAIGEIIKNSPRSVAEVAKVIKSKSLGRISGKELKRLIDSAGPKSRDEILREIMTRYRLNIDGEELNRMLGGKA